jgi:hypothetical protein
MTLNISLTYTETPEQKAKRLADARTKLNTLMAKQTVENEAFAQLLKAIDKYNAALKERATIPYPALAQFKDKLPVTPEEQRI